MKNQRICALAAGILMAAAAPLVLARDAAPNPLDQAHVTEEIRAVLAGQQQANASGLPAEALARRFYLPDVTIIGEGEAKPKRGMAQAIIALKEWNDYLGPGGQKGCQFALQEPVASDGDMASAYAVLSCQANPPTLTKQETIRQLFVFKRTPDGWRVAHEMWQAGGF